MMQAMQNKMNASNPNAGIGAGFNGGGNNGNRAGNNANGSGGGLVRKNSI
jgi:hypothetical protein